MQGEGTLLDFLQLLGTTRNCITTTLSLSLSLTHTYRLLFPSTANLEITINTKRCQILDKGKR